MAHGVGGIGNSATILFLILILLVFGTGVRPYDVEE